MIKLTAEESLYVVIDDSPLYIKSGRIYSKVDTIKKDEVVSLSFNPYGSVIFYSETINDLIIRLENDKNKVSYTLLHNIIPYNTQEIIPEKYITYSDDDYFWIPTYYLEVIEKRDREIIRKYESDIINDLGEPNEYDDGWYASILYKAIISNSCIDFTYMYFNIENIKIISNGFEIKSEKNNYDSVKGNNKSKVLRFIFDGDYLNVYYESEDKPLYSLFKIKKNDYEQLQEFLVVPREYFL